ncbi:MAG TPA: hypothetical protein V6D02_03205 [Candidatus Obscuribacterales bacterium]
MVLSKNAIAQACSRFHRWPSLGAILLCLTTAACEVPPAGNPPLPAPAPAPSVSPAVPSSPDALILPGERVGPVTPNTSRADLAAQWGEAALTDADIAVGEGFTEAGTVVNGGTDTAFAIIWVDASQSQPAIVKDFGPAWQTPEGIHIGTSLAELQQLLGPFELYGFGWDYGGTVVLAGSNLAHYEGQLILRLQPSSADSWQQHTAAWQAVQGDKLIASDDPNLIPLDLQISDLIVYLTPPEE